MCDIAEINRVKGKLEGLNYVIQDASLDFIPKALVTLSDEEMEIMGKLISKLENHPDVVQVFDNIQ